jgi:putative CRISPR-associated protein (TIGR02619 family)
MRTIISTVGTSLKGNAARAGECDLAAFLKRADPVKASAETNGLSRLLVPDDALRFLHSATDDGRACAAAIASHYERQGHPAASIEIAGLTYSEKVFAERGLRSLVTLLCGEVRAARRQGREPVLHATGGFKAEAVYVGLVGQLLRVPVYYIHEQFQDMVRLPPAPLGWDMALLLWNEEFLRWIQEDLRPTAEVEARLAGLPADVAALVGDDEEGYRTLSPLGEAYFEAYLGQLETVESTPVLFSEAARRTWEGYSPSTRERFVRWIEKVKEPGLRRSQAERISGCECLIFPQGHCDERLFVVEEAEGAVRVLELALHEDGSYSKLLKRGVRQADYSEFSPAPRVY